MQRMHPFLVLFLLHHWTNNKVQCFRRCARESQNLGPTSGRARRSSSASTRSWPLAVQTPRISAAPPPPPTLASPVRTRPAHACASAALITPASSFSDCSVIGPAYLQSKRCAREETKNANSEECCGCQVHGEGFRNQGVGGSGFGFWFKARKLQAKARWPGSGYRDQDLGSRVRV
eukprot:2359406-Rhodomonas_salina.2